MIQSKGRGCVILVVEMGRPAAESDLGHHVNSIHLPNSPSTAYRTKHRDVGEDAADADIINQPLAREAQGHALEEEDHGPLEALDQGGVRVPRD